MTEQSRHARYSNRQLPRQKRTLPLYGEKDDTGKFYKCWNCGFTCNAERDSLNTGEMGVSGVNTISNLSLLLHMDGTHGGSTFTDSSSWGHTITDYGATTSTTYYKFATASMYWGYLTVPHHSAFDLSGGYWTVDTWIHINPLTTLGTIYSHITDILNYFSIFVSVSSSKSAVVLSIHEGGSGVVSLSSDYVIPMSTWAHIEVNEYLNNYRIFIDGKLAAITSDSSRPVNYSGNVYIGAFESIGNYFYGYMDEFRVLKSAEHLDLTFDVPTEAYDPDTHYAPGTYKPDVSGGCSFCGCTNYR